MFYLSSLKVGRRLTLGFAVMLLLIASILAVALYGNSRTSAQFDLVVDINLRKIHLLNRMLDANNAVLAHRRLMLIQRGTDLDADFAHTQALQERYDAEWTALLALPRNAKGDEYLQRILDARQQADAVTVELHAAMTANEFDRAVEILLTELRPLSANWNAAIDQYLAYQDELTAQSRATYHQIEERANAAALGIGMLALLLGVLIAWAMTRSLTAPLAAASAAARALSQGNLDIDLQESGADEVGDVLRAIATTRTTLQALSSAIHQMGERHDAGQLSYRMDVDALPGQFRSIAGLINAQMEEHIGAALATGRLAARYAQGDFSQDFPRQPGEKAELTQAMDSVKATISRINGQILQLSQAAVAGDFSVRGDESQFDFGFRDMVANLNLLMATADDNLGSLSQVLKGIAAGDLSVRMEGDYHGVFARMRDDANTTVANLTRIVGRIQQATGQISTAASEIATGNTELSNRTEQQAANLEETAASMEELTSTVRQNAEHARHANELAIGAADVASSGGQVVGEVVLTMGQIEEASRRIADIITVIDGIAFQTNILALNAAVEAARAGEQGRGFAVVASEVRTLAQRSAAAAKEIKELIDNSVDRVNAGSRQVRKAGQTMAEIVDSVQRVTGIMAEISAASQEQTAGIEQVNQTVVQMDQATQQNAALVEEASAAARAMEDQAALLADAVAVFRLASGHG